MAIKIIPLASLDSAHLFHTVIGGSQALQRFAQLAYRMGVRSVAVVEGGMAPQWQQEFHTLFEDISHHLKGDLRLLLFVKGSARNEQDVAESVGAGNVVGYATLRPSPLGSIVEGFIAPQPTSDVHYITCRCSITLDIPGLDKLQLSLKGLPFMEQDGVVSRCADVSLWIASTLVAGAHPEWRDCKTITRDLVSQSLEYSPPYSRRLPSEGLRFEEVLLILERQGYDPIPYLFVTEDQKNRSDHTVYRWVESGIPVILWLQLENAQHTVVVCGHTFDPDAWWPGARIDYFPQLAAQERWLSSALWAVQYLVLDDNYGPTLAMTRGSLRNRSVAAIVAVPKAAKIYLTPEDAEIVVATFLFGTGAELVPVGEQEATPWLKWLNRAATRPDERFVLRTLLARGSDVRDHLASSYADVANGLDFPEHVWLVEISLPGIYGDKLKIGEVVLDPRIPVRFHKTGMESLLWVNVAGQLWKPGVEARYSKSLPPVALFDRWLGK